MNIYLIEQTYNNGYDTYDSAIVAALTEKDASETHPSYMVDVGWNENLSRWEWQTVHGVKNYHDRSWAPPSQVKVTCIGVAVKKFKNKQIISASFNAG